MTFLSTLIRHGIPLGGIFGIGWHPVTVLVVYWVESLLLAVATAAVTAIFELRISQRSVRGAWNVARGLLLFHVGSLLGMAVFIGIVLGGFMANQDVEEPLRWDEMREGTAAILMVVTAGFVIDLWRLDSFTTRDINARQNACILRWFLFWMLGFFGTFLIVITGRPAVYLGFFAVLKVILEGWTRLARLFRLQSVEDRAAHAKQSS